jgi:ankyrin repeat protein
MATKKATTKPARASKDDVKRLYEAIRYGQKERAISLAHAASGNYKVYKKATRWQTEGSRTVYWPMELAMERGDLELLEAFLPHVDLFSEDEDRYGSWFGRAWKSHRLEIAKLFFASLKDFKDSDGEWLRRAASDGSMELIELALPVSDPLAKGEGGQTALMAAAADMHIEVVKRLLPLSDPQAVDSKGRDALMHALEGLLMRARTRSSSWHASPSKEVLACFQSLIDACGVARRDAKGMSAMARLVQKSEYSSRDEWSTVAAEFAELLVAAGASADDADQGAGMLMKAIESGDEKLFDRLLPSSKVDRADAEGLTPLLKAAKLGRPRMLEKLVPLSNCDWQALDGSTALMLCAQKSDLPSARLLSGLTDRSLRDATGRTAAMIAAEMVAKEKSGRDELLVFIRLFDPASAKGQGILPWLVGIPELFEAALPFCDPNDKDTEGRIALHRAIDLGDHGAFEKLLPISDNKAADDSGATPLMLAIGKGDKRMFDALLPASDVHAVDCNGKTDLMLAVDRGKLEMVQALLPASDAKAADHEGLTALMIAAMGESMEMVAALMPHSDADAIDQDGKTALMHALGRWRIKEELVFFLAERSDLSMIGEAQRAAMDADMKSNQFSEAAARKLRGMFSARSERDELLSATPKPKKPSGEKSIDGSHAPPKKTRTSWL